MSETENTSIAAPDCFICDDSGLMKWRPALDGISVRRVFDGVHLGLFRGDVSLSFTLTAVQARHIASLLCSEAAT